MGQFRPLNEKKTRRIARSTGLDVIRAYGMANYTFPFVTSDHRHGLWNKKSEEWWWEDPTSKPPRLGGLHFPDCHRLFPDLPTPDDYPRVDYKEIAEDLGVSLLSRGISLPDEPTYVVTVGHVTEDEVEQATRDFAACLEADGCQVEAIRVRSMTPKWLVEVRTTAPFRHTLYVCDWLEDPSIADAVGSR